MQATTTVSRRPLAIFSYGFRPFFLVAIAFACLAIPVWLVIRSAAVMPLPLLPPQLWHGHEMLFGFIAAAIAGFLLTAVPSWTGARGFAGWPLIALTIIWLSGRAAFALASELPSWVVALAELSFLPALAAMVAVPLLRARNRNTPLLLVLGALWFVDATFVCAMTIGAPLLASQMLQVGLDIVLLLITVVGGRIVPSFTASALRRRGIDKPARSEPVIEIPVIASMIALVAIDAIAPRHWAATFIAALAATLHFVRLSGWRGRLTLREPIVWVLHLAYLWMPIGLALKAIFLATGAGWAAGWIHALGVGAASMMIVAVITRASLGHTGRALTVSKSVAIAYGVLSSAALVRVLATSAPEYYEGLLKVAGALWTLAFVILLATYGPILWRRRVDGREG
jgi:uncharacterized protein involved in response to NO